MTLQNLLETFDGKAVKAKAADPEVEALVQKTREAAFEAGYASGWEDANKASTESRQRIEAEFERNIQSLSFTYNDAVERVRSELTGLVTSLLNEFIPQTVPLNFREKIRNEILKVADDALNAPIEIVTSENCRQIVEQLLEDCVGIDAAIIEEPSLSQNQAFIRIGAREVEIDFLPLLDALKSQFEAIQNNQEGHTSHG